MSLVTSPDQKVASEDDLGQKWDRCVADVILKTGGLVLFLPISAHSTVAAVCILHVFCQQCCTYFQSNLVIQGFYWGAELVVGVK